MLEIGEFQKIDHLIEKMKLNGVNKIIFKRLSTNDNSKNQIYLGSGYDVLQTIPMGEIYTDRSQKDSKRDRFKANINLYWLDTTGEIFHAPKSQLILYPKYPEVRLSGFLAQAKKRPSMYMASRMENRIIFIGITNDEKIIGHVTGPNNSISNELKKFKDSNTNIILKNISDTSKSLSTKDQLLKKLLEIHEMGWVEGQILTKKNGLKHYSAPNAGGYTLEALCGVHANGDNKPDYLGWELKQHRTKLNTPLKGNSKVTLISPEPTGGLYHLNTIKFMNEFGYVNSKGIPDRFDFTGTHIYGVKSSKTGLLLSFEGYDLASETINDVNGGIILMDVKRNRAIKWHFSKLIQMWNKKHAQAVIVPCEKKTGTNKFRYGNVVALGEGTNFTKFLFSLINGNCYYDPATNMTNISSKKPKLHQRNPLRIKPIKLPVLYDKCEEINLLTLK